MGSMIQRGERNTCERTPAGFCSSFVQTSMLATLLSYSGAGLSDCGEGVL